VVDAMKIRPDKPLSGKDKRLAPNDKALTREWRGGISAAKGQFVF